MKRDAVRLVLIAVVFAVPTAPALAESRPHVLKGTGQFISANDFIGVGNATHLGRFTESGSVQFSPSDDPFVLQIDGCAIHTAANGDEVWETLSGQINLLTGVGTATANYAGGTGRFTDATGSATISFQLLPDGSYTFRGEGTIDY